jgi:tyrosyl-tRNA synthetase
MVILVSAINLSNGLGEGQPIALSYPILPGARGRCGEWEDSKLGPKELYPTIVLEAWFKCESTTVV